MWAHRTVLRVFVIFVALAWLFTAAGTARAQTITLHARLILASNEPAAQDPRLEDLEYKLRRIFGFEYYQMLGKGEGIVELPGDASLVLGRECRLSISAAQARGGQIRASVQWLRGKEVVLNTTVVMGRGAGVILGGVSHESGTLLVALDAR
jgi:hypothetical protein